MIEWLHVFGRLHPLVLHLPIGLLAGLGTIEIVAILRARPAPRDITALLAWLTAASGVAAAATGFVLSRESTYAGDVLTKHLYLGIALAGACLLLAALHARQARGPFRAALLLALALLIPTGHLGGTMTHGEGFLTSPLRASADRAPQALPDSAAPAPARADAIDFHAAVAPILHARCTTCHGESRRKGDLALHTPDAIAAGGKHGPVIAPSDPGSSELLRRLRLPLDHDDHMPPRDKPQLTADEVLVLERWIAAGAPLDAAGTTPPGPARADASDAPPSVPSPSGPPPAPPAAIAALRERLVHVEPVERNSALLWIDFAAAAPTFTDADVQALLAPLREQAAELSLARSAITDRTLAFVATMPNLRRLDLRGTGVTDDGVHALRSHPRLEELVLAQTRLSDASVADLAAMPALARLNLWRSGVSLDGARSLTVRRAALVVETGTTQPAAALESEQTLALTSTAPPPPSAPPAPGALAPVNTTCPVSGKPVAPDFVIVHRGRIIGLCCPLCAAQFWADPDKYAPALDRK